ncbi:MAG: Sec-independent protein translocase protein TatB [Halieaceae bacterium]|nr:MAG: twin-arginine translocase subunit TatB [Halieaceae bacterium]CAI8448003.1 MAG: Sec-independent protein translocase protein TatB [Halieaceae bacterium]
MFDIGFAELLLIGVVGLLVVGPEQLPGAVRTVLAWVNRFRRSFDQIRTEVRRELHNDEIMQKLKAESQQLEQQVRDTTQSVEQEIQALGNEASDSLQGSSNNSNSVPSPPSASSSATSPTATSAAEADANEGGDTPSKTA